MLNIKYCLYKIHKCNYIQKYYVQNHTSVLYDETAGGVCSFSLLFNIVCFLESVCTTVTGANMYDIDVDKSITSTVLSSPGCIEKLSF